MKLTMMVALLCLLALPACAFVDNVLGEAQEIAEGAIEGVELSLLGGTVGWGAGAFWPLVEIDGVETTIGPFIAFGNQLVAAGVGAHIPVEIPVLENFVDFLAAGGAYRYNNWTFEVWVGKTIPMR